jgi:hypothetical protein
MDDHVDPGPQSAAETARQEDQLRQRLALLVEAGPDPEARSARIDEKVRALRRSHIERRRFLVRAAAATGIAGMAGSAIAWRAVARPERKPSVRVSDDLDDATSSGAMERAGWEPVASAPLRPRTGPAIVWAGDQLFVWGGNGELAAPPDTATWSPGEGWTGLPDAPTGSTSGRAFAVWDGREVLVGMSEADANAPRNGPEVGEEEDGYGLLAHDPAHRSWREAALLARDSETQRNGRGRQAVLLGDGRLLVAVLAALPDGGRGEDLRIVDPASGAAETVELGPFAQTPYPDSSGEVALTATDAGDHVIAIPNWDRRPWVLDVATGEWRQLPAPAERESLHLGPATAIGERVIMAESSGATRWILDPSGRDGGLWTPMAECPFPAARWRYEPVWNGTELFTPGAAYDPETDTWREVPPPPRGPDRQRTLQALWADDALLLFGGEEHTCPDNAECDRTPGPDTLDGWLLPHP